MLIHSQGMPECERWKTISGVEVEKMFYFGQLEYFGRNNFALVCNMRGAGKVVVDDYTKYLAANGFFHNLVMHSNAWQC